ncbi:nuclear transport factor 2 family protein [Alteromonas sp. KUL49]|uniref:nuclear transport factor 2 family protein n=1 Tax=Alteromonas sp. KUL49 TaxID=2480798 RepID=UPI00102EE221|nr:nuclear transport factor 2 family protein [Alteromonas sp. KUL49]TAP39197.1 hypothetical protein EYS00_11650 [Alteromonas sp. KUL49]GEA11971.1 hypothetical protein KUL49_23460 [Alteromonas sp. KUL49]
MKNYSFIIACWFALTLQPLAANTETLFATNEETLSQIKQTIYNNYIGGQIIGSAEMIQQAFDKNAVMLRPVKQPMDGARLERWDDMHSLAERWAVIPNDSLLIDEIKLLAIDVIDQRLATVQLKVEDRVYEVLTLVKIDQDWKIASKVYINQ